LAAFPDPRTNGSRREEKRGGFLGQRTESCLRVLGEEGWRVAGLARRRENRDGLKYYVAEEGGVLKRNRGRGVEEQGGKSRVHKEGRRGEGEGRRGS